MRKIKILFIIDKMTAAGAQKHLGELISGLNEDKFKSKLVTLEEIGVKRIYDFSAFNGLIKLIKIIREFKPDIVQTYLFSANVFGVMVANIASVPYIITSRRSTGMIRECKWYHILAYRLTNRWVDKIVCVSNAVKRVVLAKEKADPEKIEVIYNGVDVDKFIPRTVYRVQRKGLGIREDEFVVGMIANFSWIKGHKEFIEAANLVLKEVPNTKFILIGDGPFLQSHKVTTSQSHILKDRMLFLGSRKDAQELLYIIDVSVNASYSEGMSNTVLESMAAGVPVVATAVDGNLETVVNEVTGLLVPSKQPKALSEAIVRILKDRDLAKNMGENAKKIVNEKFNLSKMLTNIENLYLKLVKEKALWSRN